jgi:predicted short-subunit dehydrogenase-like oxidoreductase (DUF2520 family)
MIPAPLSIAFLGAGNVAWHLSQAFEQAGHRIVTVYSRSLARAEFLAEALQQAHPTHQLDFSNTKADLFLVAVKDDAVAEVLQKAIFPPNSLVVHTSGSLPMGIFSEYTHLRGGVFYPLQTFSQGQAVDLKYTPIGIEGTTPVDTELLLSLAASITTRSLEVVSAERQIIHLAAVFACNFTNHLLGISQQLLGPHQLDFTLLQPLVAATIQKSFANIPFRVQTGPAIRSDETTLNSHRHLLQNQPGYLAVYNILTQSIQRQASEDVVQESK